jgi:hypothetical protein
MKPIWKYMHMPIPKKKMDTLSLGILDVVPAVFCGFLAENWREHYVEHKRSRELSFSLKTDLVRDTATLKRIIANRKERTEILNRLMDEIEKPQNLRNDTIIVAFGEDELLRRSYFMSDAGTYDQIKQAGFLRYF